MDYAHACLLRKQTSGSQFVVIYVNSLNLIDTLEEIKETTEYLKLEFEINDFGRPNIILST